MMSWRQFSGAAAVGVAAMMLTLTACNGTTPSSTDQVKGAVAVLDLPADSTAYVAEAAAVSERLAWQAIQAGEELNRVVSPSSLSMSLAQVAEGAEGASLVSIDAALGLTGDDRSRAFGALRQSLAQYDSLPREVDADKPPSSPVVHMASRVVAIDAELEQPFLDRISEFYDAPATQVTLQEAKAEMDRWVKLHTAGLIPQSAFEPDGSSVAVMQDALLFAAAWEREFLFEPNITFETPDGPEEVEGMQSDFVVPYAEGERWVAVRLPYDDNLAAEVILPAPGLSPDALTDGELNEAREALSRATPEQVTVTMPAFDLTSKTDLVQVLPQIDLSDLGGIVDDGFGSGWAQQTKLIVTAKGTVGAAVTEVMVAASGTISEPKTMTVDRPYVFRVLDTRTGWPLFLAAISDPSEES